MDNDKKNEEFRRRLRREDNGEVLGKIRYITKNDSSYPACFREYSRMPDSFYVLGTLPDPEKRTVAIVGARNCTTYGREQAMRFGRVLAQHGVQIISGMAYGIDAWGQSGAIAAGGKVFSVLGSGVDVCYPRQNYALYRRIIREGGGIISEYPPGSMPAAWHFPIRNRLISAFSDIVLVVEAKLKSGSLITADYAIEQGKSLYAVPGRNGDPLSEGCNRLISQGAGIAWTPEVLLEELGFDCSESYSAMYSQKSQNSQKRKLSNADIGERPEDAAEGTAPEEKNKLPEGYDLPDSIIKNTNIESSPSRPLPEKWEHADDFQRLYPHMTSTPKSLDTLQKQSGLDLATLTGVIMQLCISGYAEEAAPGFYIRKL